MEAPSKRKNPFIGLPGRCLAKKLLPPPLASSQIENGPKSLSSTPLYLQDNEEEAEHSSASAEDKENETTHTSWSSSSHHHSPANYSVLMCVAPKEAAEGEALRSTRASVTEDLSSVGMLGGGTHTQNLMSGSQRKKMNPTSSAVCANTLHNPTHTQSPAYNSQHPTNSPMSYFTCNSAKTRSLEVLCVDASSSATSNVSAEKNCDKANQMDIKSKLYRQDKRDIHTHQESFCNELPQILLDLSEHLSAPYEGPVTTQSVGLRELVPSPSVNAIGCGTGREEEVILPLKVAKAALLPALYTFSGGGVRGEAVCGEAECGDILHDVCVRSMQCSTVCSSSLSENNAIDSTHGNLPENRGKTFTSPSTTCSAVCEFDSMVNTAHNEALVKPSKSSSEPSSKLMTVEEAFDPLLLEASLVLLDIDEKLSSKPPPKIPPNTNIDTSPCHEACSTVNLVVKPEEEEGLLPLTTTAESLLNTGELVSQLDVHTPSCMDPRLSGSFLFSRLSPQQLEAVMSPIESPLCIVAGPGSGKTSTLIARMVRVLFSKMEPVLALTFTRKAADEMKMRIDLTIKSVFASSEVSRDTHTRQQPEVKPQTRNLPTYDLGYCAPGRSMKKAKPHTHPSYMSVRFGGGSNDVDLKIFLSSASSLYVGTMHSFCRDLLKSYGPYIGIPSTFKILGKDEQFRLLRDVIDEVVFQLKSRDSNHLQRNLLSSQLGDVLDASLNRMKSSNSREIASNEDDEDGFDEYSYDRYTENGVGQSSRRSCSDPVKHREIALLAKIIKSCKYSPKVLEGYQQENAMVYKLFLQYQEKLTKHEPPYVDYDDLIIASVRLLEVSEDAKMLVQSRWPHVFCDEFQDFSRTQFRLLQALATRNDKSSSGSITVVGDDDQSIYSWRGTEGYRVFDYFRASFPNYKLRLLECNWRSTQSILTVANRLISYNAAFRIPKNLYTLNEPGRKVDIAVLSDSRTQASYVIKRILQLKMESSRCWSDFAILARTNAALVGIEKLLNNSSNHCSLERNLPSSNDEASTKFPRKSVNSCFEPTLKALLSSLPEGKIPLYNTAKASKGDLLSKPEVLDILSYCRLIIDLGHASSFLRVLNRPKRLLGMAIVREFEALAMPHSKEEKKSSPLKNIQRLNFADDVDGENDPPGSYFQAASQYVLSKRSVCTASVSSSERSHSKQLSSLGNFLAMLKLLRVYASKAVSARCVLIKIFQLTGYLDWLSSERKNSPSSSSSTSKGDAQKSTSFAESSAFHGGFGSRRGLFGVNCEGFTEDMLLSHFPDEFLNSEASMLPKSESLLLLMKLASDYYPGSSKMKNGMNCILTFLKDLDIGLREGPSQRCECVTLSTIHQAKGLEWPVVLLIGANENAMIMDQLHRELKTQDAVEKYITEERRLAYVAFTRAKDVLVVSCILNDGGENCHMMPARFLSEAGLLAANSDE